MHGSTLPNSQLELFYFYILRAGSDHDKEDMNYGFRDLVREGVEAAIYRLEVE